jgi:hypothetical protein
MLLLRLVVMIIQLAGLMAFFTDYVQWNLLLSVLLSVLLVMWLPLVATVFGFIGAIKVWLWPWWLALLVFLPGLALSLMAIAGVGAASLLSVFVLRKRQGQFAEALRRAQQQQGQQPYGQSGPNQAPPHQANGEGDIIEGEVVSSKVDDDAPKS